MLPRLPRIALALILLLAAVLLSRAPRALGPVSSVATPILAPVHAATTAVAAWLHGARALLRDAGHMSELEAQLATSAAERAALSAAYTRLHEAASEAEAAAAVIAPRPMVHARVVAQTNRAGMHQLTIALPPDTRVVPGAAVIARGSLIGTVRDVGTDRARVQLLTDTGVRIAARASDAAESLGIVEPGLGGGLLLTHVPITATVAPQTNMVTAPLDDRVPDGLPIGTIADVRVDADGFFQTAVVTPFTNPYHAIIVTILPP